MTLQKKRILLFVSILVATFISFAGLVRTFFYSGLGWSFPVSHSFDQLLPLIIAVVTTLVWWARQKFSFIFFKKIPAHLPSIVLLGIITVFVMAPLLNHYFFKEDAINLLTLDQASRGVRSEEIARFFTWADGYPFSVFFGFFSLFHLAAKGYMIFTISVQWLSAVVLYLFGYTLLGSRTLSFVVAALFVASPIYLEVFNWFYTAAGFPVAFAVFTLSLLIFLQAKRSPHSTILLVLSWLMTFATLKLGFVRTAIYPIALLILNQAGEERLTGKRWSVSLKHLWPHFAIFGVALGFFAERYTHIYSNQTGFSFFNRFGRSLILMLAQSVPFSWGRAVFAVLPETLTIEKTLVLGGALVIALAVVTVSFIRFGARGLRPVVVLGLIWFFSEAIFTSLLGDNAGRGALDFTFLHWPYEPGSKYLHLAAPGLYLGLVAWVYGIFPKIRARVRSIAILVLALPLISAFGLEARRAHTEFVKEISIPAHVFFTQKLPHFLPKTNERLMLYSTSTSPIDGLMKGGLDLPAYGLPAADYTHTFSDVQKEYQAGTFQLEQVFSFEFDPTTLEFRDTSDNARQMLKESQ